MVCCLVVSGAVWTAAFAQSPEPRGAVTADSVKTRLGSRALADLTREDIADFTYDDLIALPLEQLMAIADKLEISIDELLSMKMSVASKTATTIREQPGILSVITREDILRSGARDLVDVLRMVPGFGFGMDVEGVMGTVVRGNWAHEGKLLVLVDGQMMNEKWYSATPMELRFPVDNIRRVEIIRGPGSAIYGGFAELGVINIITLRGEDYSGLAASRSIGFMGKAVDGGLDVTPAHNFTWFGCGAAVRDFSFSLSAFHGNGHRSDETVRTLYTLEDSAGGVLLDSSGAPVFHSQDFREITGTITSTNVNLGLGWRGLKARFIYDTYYTAAVDASTYWDSFTKYAAEIRWDIRAAGDALIVTPKYNLTYDIPWHTDGWYENTSIMRNAGELSAVWNPAPVFTLVGGVVGEYDNFFMALSPWDSVQGVPSSSEDTLFFNGSDRLSYWNIGLYLQGIVRFPRIGLNLTAGGRFEYHELYESSFAPRVAITQTIGNFHYKFLYSRAFRPPNIGNIEYNQDIKPEETDVFELELGYRAGKNLMVTANVFDITINEPIVYWANDTADGYDNAGRLGSTGFEIEATARYPRVNATVNYSYYFANSKPMTAVDSLFVASTADQAYYAAPQHKLTGRVTARAWKNLYVSPSVVYIGRAYANTALSSYDGLGEPVTSSLDPAWLLNLYVSYEDLFTRGLTIGVGVYDILDRDLEWAQAYSGWEAPFPGTGREAYVKVGYALKKRR